jgi:hypothetical protein
MISIGVDLRIESRSRLNDAEQNGQARPGSEVT